MLVDGQSRESPREQERPPLLGYASALRSGTAGGAGGGAADVAAIFRQGQTLIAADGALLPARCILCGDEAAREPLRLTFSWDASFQVTRESSSLQLRRKAFVLAPLCASHRRQWHRGRLTGITGILCCTAIMIAGIVLAALSENSQVPLHVTQGIWIVIAGFAGVILFLFWFALCTRTLSCERIADGYLYLQGAAPAFLAALPELPQHPSTPPPPAPTAP